MLIPICEWTEILECPQYKKWVNDDDKPEYGTSDWDKARSKNERFHVYRQINLYDTFIKRNLPDNLKKMLQNKCKQKYFKK